MKLGDWEWAGLHTSERIAVRRPSRRDERVFVAEVVELPPMAWVVLAQQIREPATPARP